jgi:hypothetical protein
VTAGLAVVLTAASGATAAVRLPAKSVGTKQLKRGAVTRDKLHGAAVGILEMKQGSLRARDVASRALHPGATGPVGPVGPVGPTGASGREVPAVTSINYRVSQGSLVGDKLVSSGCSSRDSVASVGVALSNATTGEAWLLDAHATSKTGYEVNMTDQSATGGTYTVIAICVR